MDNSLNEAMVRKLKRKLPMELTILSDKSCPQFREDEIRWSSGREMYR
jgi:hypothetical protein